MKKIIYRFKGIIWLLPSLCGTMLFVFIPFFDVIKRSFSENTSTKFVGIANYIEILNNAAFGLAIKNTLRFIVICIPLLIIFSLLISVFLAKSNTYKNIIKTIYLLPMAIPVAAVVLVWKVLFDNHGFVNGALADFGFTTRAWMNSGYSFWILVFSYIWRNLGYNIVLWLAGLSTISDSLYEAARVDGASEIMIFRKIVVPNLLPTLYTITVLSLLNSFKVFREAYLVGGDYPHESMYLIQHIFNNWFSSMSFDKMSAAAVLVTGAIFLLVLMLQKAWEENK